MPLYSYTADLAPKVESGDKCQTYRTKRTPRPKVGQKACNYAGSYSQKRQHLGSPEITDVIDVLIGGKGIIFNYGKQGEFAQNDLYCLNIEAQLDGFKDWRDMRDWFDKTHGLPFEGDLIKWQ